jgi:N-acetylglutamate synthase-like GNAT family acetyltransferase
MLRRCEPDDFEAIFAIINDGAEAYRGVIPPDRWHDPYMPREDLRDQIDAGVEFWGIEDDGALVAVMGIQPVMDVTLIRHAYVRTANQNQGHGKRLLEMLRSQARGPVLIGAWKDASWAIRFYQRNGFELVSHAEKQRLLRTY